MRELFRKHPFSHAAPAVAAIAFALLPPGSASAAYTFKTLHTFCVTNCYDGGDPLGRLVMDQSGNLYGTASYGGKYGVAGVVFKLVPNADKSRYKEYVLHAFCRKTNCPDGFLPGAGLILDVDGNLYGTAAGGGANGGGTIFKLTHVANGWTFSVLKSLCQTGGQACTDGGEPLTSLSYAGQLTGAAWDESSPLYGTTNYGGTYGNGVVYELTKDGSNWLYYVIHDFKTSSGPNEPLVDAVGNIFGTTLSGGKNGGGLMYRLASGTWTETVLHNFCNTGDCADGKGPVGRLALDNDGNLFGTTLSGGSNRNDLCQSLTGGNCGVLFKYNGGTYSVLYNFCSLTNCDDGISPYAGVILDSSGNLFGTTTWGGAGASGEDGTVFEFSGGTESVLYSFCMQANCTDGKVPEAGLTMDSSGNLFGATAGGGSTNSEGTVFRVVP